MSSNCNCCTTKKCCKSTLSSFQRPSNGVFTTNKVIARQCVNTPYICSSTGTVDVQGVKIGGNQVDFGSAITAGQDPCFTNGMVALTNTNLTIGSWEEIDLSASQYNVLAGNTTDNCLFIGSDNSEVVGFCYLPKLAEVGLSEDSIWEYWNGANWVMFCIMVSQSVFPHNQYANTPFERIVGTKEVVRFEQMINMNLVKLELNGFNKFWVRMRLTNNITSIPAVNGLKLLQSHTLIGENGFVEHFGKAMPLKELIFHRKLLETVNGIPPSNEDVRLAAGFFIDGINNRFDNNPSSGQDAIAGIFRIPFGTATNCKIMLVLSWYPLNSAIGNVDWNVEYTYMKQGTKLNNNGSLTDPDLPTTTIQNITATPAENGELTKTMFDVPINTLLPLEFIAIKVFRIGNSVADTYSGNVVLADLSANIKVWY